MTTNEDQSERGLNERIAALEAENKKLTGFYKEIVAEIGHDQIIKEYRGRGNLLAEETRWRKEADERSSQWSEIAGKHGYEKDIAVQAGLEWKSRAESAESLARIREKALAESQRRADIVDGQLAAANATNAALVKAGDVLRECLDCYVENTYTPNARAVAAWTTTAKQGVQAPAADDTKRLDWLEKTDGEVHSDMGAGDGPSTWFAYRKTGNRNDIQFKAFSALTIRAAIDAAMEGGK